MRPTRCRPALRTALLALFASGVWAACDFGRIDSAVSGAPPSGAAAFVAGQVYCDVDCSGAADPGEAGIAEVHVRLVDGARVVGEAVTDAVGRYQITASLAAGSYRIEVDPATLQNPLASNGAASGGATPLTIDVPLAATGGSELIFTGRDFGVCPSPTAGVLGDRVWHDLDCNGLQDPGEPGLDGVVVRLFDATGTPLAAATTGPGAMGLGGHYEFAGLAPGTTYVVAVDLATVPIGFAPAPCGVGQDPTRDADCMPAIVALGCADPTIDFGFCSMASGEIGDRVWLDHDGDGIQDPDEADAGIDGVVVRLRDAQGQIVRTTTTHTLAQPGCYRFTGLAAGTYAVEIDPLTLPGGLTAAPCMAGNDPEVDNDCSPAAVTLPHDTAIDRSIDFGFVAQFHGTIGDRVWHDLDADGLQDPGEPGLPGVRVRLQAAAGGQWRAAFTDPAGRYEFPALPPGAYTIEVDVATIPAGFAPSPCEVGPDRAVDSNCSPAMVALVAEQTDDTIDFGFLTLFDGRIGDYVWDDLDCDGLQGPAEPGLAGVLVLLRDAQGAPVAMQATDTGGRYQFSGLAAGDYVVEIDPTTLPPGYVATTCEVGNDPTVDSNCSPAPVTLPTSGANDPSIDFGFHAAPTASIGDLVWFDVDADGIQDGGDPGFGGIVVVLRDAAGALLASTVSAADGHYAFTGLCAGTYIVEFEPASVPPWKAPTWCNVGNDPAIDSNCSPAIVVLPTNSTHDDTIDFGFRAP